MKKFISFLLVFTPIFAQNFNPVDAVSSASKEYGVSTGKAYTDSAVLTIKNSFRNGTLGIKWGKTAEMTDGNKSIPVNTSAPVVRLTGLTPNTLYNFQLFGTWVDSYPDLGKGTFKTYQSTTIVPQLNTFANSAYIQSFTQNKLVIVLNEQSFYSLSVYSINGVNVFHSNKKLSAGINYIQFDRHLSKGIYIVNVQYKGESFSKHIIIQ